MIELLEKGISLTTQVITLLIAVGALLISLIQIRRGRRQANEDIIFQQKLQAYRDLIKRSYDFLDEAFSLLDEIPEFEGTEEEWGQTRMPELFKHYYPMITDNEAVFAEYTVILPEEFINKFKQFSFKATRLIVEHYHFDNEHSIKAYEHLQDLHNDLLALARKDLSVDILNTRLNYRLS